MAKANNNITGNNSLTTINNLALAIEALADVIPPEQSETLPTFVVEGLLVGIQHLAQRINQLTQNGLVQGGEGL